MATAARTLSTAEIRREELLQAAERAFATRGYHGTPTTEIAKAAGISQAYLFRLFPTKLELFVACVERCFARTAELFRAAAAEARANGIEGPQLLEAMGGAYGEMLRDPDHGLLHLQMQTYAASAEPEIRAAAQTGYRGLFELAQRESGADDDALQAWFGFGMLMNVLASIGAPEVDQPWAHALLGGKDIC
jgi:AcrR family transcriptional regulator